MTKTTKTRKTKAPVQPYPVDFDGVQPPRQLWKPRRFGKKQYTLRNKKVVTGILHLPGRGSTTPKIMFVSPCVLEEEVETTYSTQPAMLRGAAASLFLRSVRRLGFKDADWYYTALCKYPVKNQKPKAQDIRWNADVLDDEIKRLKPKIIVCMGKAPFDYLTKLKFKLSEIQGGFFRHEDYDCLVFVMDQITTPLYKPEYLERFLVDLKELKREFSTMTGGPVVKLATDYSVIDTSEKLGNLMTELQDRIASGSLHTMAVDCEWQGQTAWGGMLRSLQMCWKPGVAVYLRLAAPQDGKCVYVMDRPLPEIRPMLTPLRDARLKFVGHNIAADGVWMEEHLEIPMYQRTTFDTMFAQHCLDEYADLKLERNAVKYTDLGRYDIPLLRWKKENKVAMADEEGYGLIPDEVIIPYGQRDVDATLRIYPKLLKQLREQNLLLYYYSVCLPFVTDGFMEMMRTGLPVDREYLERMRTTFSRNRELINVDFRKSLYKEACQLLSNGLAAINKEQGTDLFLDMYEAMRKGELVKLDQIFEAVKEFAGAKKMPTILPLYFHWRDAQQFNIDSPDQLRRWLFDVKNFEPLKTTKRDGIQMAWERVKSFPKDRQAEFTPAADKQTIKVLSGKDPLVARVEELKSVGNIVKAFLGGDDDTGKVEGLFKWIQSDEKVHCNYSLTETARPRTWKPNILNWPKAIAKPIERSFIRINKNRAKDKFKEIRFSGWPTAEIRRVVKAEMEAPTSVRSAVKAPPGWVIIDNDLKTAEVVALAYVSGDDNLIRVLTEPDPQFARIDAKDPKKVIRIAYNANSPYPQEQWDDKLIFPETDPRILREASGKIMHPKRDVHWEMGEKVQELPREKCDERMSRDGVGKVGNFSIPYGSAEGNLERLVEVNTGKKPPEGTGAKMLAAYQELCPTAWRFLLRMEQMPENPGWYRSVSGRVRHFCFNNLSDVEGLSEYARKGILSPLTRQARNFPIQELVAATTAKALIRFMQERKERGLRSQVMSLLYDALTLLAPLEEAKVASELIRNCMTIWTPWTVGDRTFNFEADASFNIRWGVKMTKDEKNVLEPYLV